MIILVAAVGRNGVIGVGGSLPWSLPADLRHFREITTGHPVIMGRATFDSIGRPLPNRTNIVMTRNRDYAPDGVHRGGSVAESLAIARQAHGGNSKICIIGGGQIYRQFLAMADRMELTIVDMAPDGDVYFPHWNDHEWHQSWSEHHGGSPSFEFARFERAAPGALALAQGDAENQGTVFDRPGGATD